MVPRSRRLKAPEIEKILVRYGFELVSQSGSHRKWRHPEKRLQVIVPMHKGRDLPIGTLRNILANAQIPEEDWKL